MIKRYTSPKLNKGPKPKSVPKGSTLEKEWARNSWYVGYSYNRKQYREKKGLNQIADPKEKALYAEAMVLELRKALANGYDPENPEQYHNLSRISDITLEEAINDFLNNVEKYARTKTVQTYRSKLQHLSDNLGMMKLAEVTTKTIENYIHAKINGHTNAFILVNSKRIETSRKTLWTHDTVKAARRIFNAFFNWCVKEKYVSQNPVKDVDNKRIKSVNEPKDRHVPFTEEHAKRIMQFLKENNSTIYHFCNVIYYTCIRPGEIIQLKIKHIDLKNRRILIPTSVMKNTRKHKPDIVDIPEQLVKIFELMGVSSRNGDEYLFTRTDKQTIRTTQFGANTAYNGFKTALKKMGLDNCGYDLYSFKHFSNITRLRNGWTLDTIMKLNRHTSIQTTSIYLKKITRDTDISNKDVPDL